MQTQIKHAMSYITSCSVYQTTTDYLAFEKKLKGYDLTLFMLSKRCVQKLSIVWHYLTCGEMIPKDIQLEITGSKDPSVWESLRTDHAYKTKVKVALEKSIPSFQKL